MGPRDPIRRSLFYGWWYVSIGLGFCILAIRGMIFDGRRLLTVMRWAICAGFLILGLGMLIPAWRARRGRTSGSR